MRCRLLVGISVIHCALAMLCGCAQEKQTGEAPRQMTLEFWDFPHLPATMDYIKKSIADFEAQNPGVRVKYTRLPWQDGQQKITLAVNAGTPPDMATQVNVSPQFLAQDVLEPLDEHLAPIINDIYPEYLEPIRWMGHIYAVPWYKACYVGVLNLDVFDARGVEPPKNGRWTWNEFVQKMQALTVNDGPTSRTWGLATNIGPGEYEAYSVIYNTQGARVLQPNADGTVRSCIGDPSFVQGVKRLQELEFNSKVTVQTIGSMTQEQSWSVWRDTRRVAVTFQGGWCVTAIQRYNDDLQKNNAKKMAEGRVSEVEKPLRWQIVAPPTDDENTSPVLGSSGLGTFVVFKQKDKARRDMAIKLAIHLIQGEGQRVMKDENCYPSLKSTGNLWARDAELSGVFELFPSGVVMPLVPGGERVDTVLQTEIQKALLVRPGTGLPQVDAEQASRIADEKVNAILQRALRRRENSAQSSSR